jgi:hypothetical protein
MNKEPTKEIITKWLDFASVKDINIEDEWSIKQAIRRLIETQPDKYKIFHDHIKAHFEKEHPDWNVVCKICGRDIDMIFQQKNAQIKEGEGKSAPQNLLMRIKEE